jgi:hypothetical protein
MSLHVGQKVECMDASPSYSTNENILTLHAVYEIEGFDTNPRTGLFLLGVRNVARYGDGTLAGWRKERFRLVIERKTDISIFTAMLTPSNEKVRA